MSRGNGGLVRASSGGGGGGASSAPLAVVSYAPASDAAYVASTGASLVALDTAHLTASFTVPASGNVVVSFNAAITVTASSAMRMGLLNHSGGAQLGNTVLSYDQPSATLALDVITLSHQWYLAGLTPGATLGIDIAAVGSGATGATIHAQGATGKAGFSPAVIVVNAA